MRAERDIYDPTFVQGVFDRCSTGYRNWSQIASFGLAGWWRRKCVRQLPLPGTGTPVIADIMTGTGETWPYLIKRFPYLRKIHAIDISSGMAQHAVERAQMLGNNRIEVYRQDILDDKSAGPEFDVVICAFGLNTFNREQQEIVANKVAAMLKPGGVVSFIETSEPANPFAAWVYMTYLRKVLPAIQRLFASGTEDYSMLGTYTRKFSDCEHFAQCLKDRGFDATFRSHFFGCVTAVTGRKKSGTF